MWKGGLKDITNSDVFQNYFFEFKITLFLVEYWNLQEGELDVRCTTSHFDLHLLIRGCFAAQPELLADTRDTSEEITVPLHLILSYLENFKLDNIVCCLEKFEWTLTPFPPAKPSSSSPISAAVLALWTAGSQSRIISQDYS